MTNLDRLFSEVAHEEDLLLSSGHRRALVRRRLLGANPRDRVSQRTLLIPLAVAATLALASAGATLAWQAQHSRSLTADYGNERRPVSSGAWLTAPETSSSPLRFSDGTHIEVAPRAQMRLLQLGKSGAKVALESGRAAVDVAHGKNRYWEVGAGPFLVRVTGTRFDLNWDPSRDRFDLVLTEGQVELVGCGFGAGRKLVAGQRVHASCRDNLVEIAYSRDNDASSLLQAEAPSPKEQEAPDSGSTSTSSDDPATADPVTPSSSYQPAKVDWVSLAREGKYKAALAAANRLGFAAECARVSADELALLADAARQAGDAKKARMAYTQMRQRFGGGKHASLAAFHLGVLEFDQVGSYAKAADWFRTYVRENPTGPLTREARGRLIEALHRTGSPEATALASAYLRDYPSGPHAQLARRIVSSSP